MSAPPADIISRICIGMSDFFSKLASNPGGLEEELLGPDYSYFSHIKNPEQVGVRADGSDKAITADLNALGAYGKGILIAGSSSAIKGCEEGQPCALGQKFFLETGAKCKDVASGEKVTRSLYENYVPDGSIPFISAGPGGARMHGFKGLIPGMLSNIAQVDPMGIFMSFLSGAEPPCRSVTMQTGNFPDWGTGTAFVTDSDLGSMNSCWFPDKQNPITGDKCEGFTGDRQVDASMPKDKLSQVYLTALGLLGLYILMRTMEKGR